MQNKQTQNRRSKSCYQSAYHSNYIGSVSKKTYIKVLSNTSSINNSTSSLSDLYIYNNQPINEQQCGQFMERHTTNHEKGAISNGNSYHMRSVSMPNKTLYLHKTIDIPYDLSYLAPTSISINFLAYTSEQCINKLDSSQQNKNNFSQKKFQFYISGNQKSNNQYFYGKSSVNESPLDSLEINSLSLENKNHKNRAFGQIKHQKNHKKSFCYCSQKQNTSVQKKQKIDQKALAQQKEIKLKVKHILLPKRAPIPQ